LKGDLFLYQRSIFVTPRLKGEFMTSTQAFVPITLTPDQKAGSIQEEATPAPLNGARWYTTTTKGDGLVYHFPAGTLAQARYLTADLFVDGNQMVAFQLQLREGVDGPAFKLIYGVLNQYSVRIRMPLEATNQNRWRYPREGGWLKPCCMGDRVDLAKVDTMTITVERKGDQSARWCLTPITATLEEPPLLTDPYRPKGPLLDEPGQSTLHEWPSKSRNTEEITTRLHTQLATAQEERWPATFSRWGSWTGKRFEGTGFFRVHHDGQRWWLVDPEGYPFWSTGLDCVRVDVGGAIEGLEKALTWLPDPEGPYKAAYTNEIDEERTPIFSYLAANFIRAFGPERWYECWGEIALAQLRRLGFNTVGNWSDWEIARAAGFPYVRPLLPQWPNTPHIYRDFPDVFDPNFAIDCTAFAEQLRATVTDPAFIGYFLMNEPTWGFTKETPAAGMLFTTSGGHSRQALADFLRARYGDEDALSRAWGITTTFSALAEGSWNTPLNAAATADLSAFSTLLAERFFKSLSDACRAVDPNHLNLGIRCNTIPPDWLVKSMDSLDVFSINIYNERLPVDLLEPISAQLNRPIIIGEWHFGALDVGLPSSGLLRVRNQEARGQAYRVYTEYAAAQPWCVGVHYFTLYDQSAIGRSDGENYNIGFLDVCNRPYEELARAARATHERLYQVVCGEVAAYDDAPEYLPPTCL
jgi:hypothetical protein